MNRDNQFEPMLMHQFKAQEGEHHHKKINKKTGRGQSPNVTGRNTSTNNLSNEEPTPTEKKIQFLNPNMGI